MSHGKPKKHPTTIRLAATDAAFVLRADGKQEAFIPDGDDDADVPPHVFEATMLMFVLADPETHRLVKERWEKTVAEKEREN